MSITFLTQAGNAFLHQVRHQKRCCLLELVPSRTHGVRLHEPCKRSIRTCRREKKIWRSQVSCMTCDIEPTLLSAGASDSTGCLPVSRNSLAPCGTTTKALLLPSQRNSVLQLQKSRSVCGPSFTR